MLRLVKATACPWQLSVLAVKWAVGGGFTVTGSKVSPTQPAVSVMVRLRCRFRGPGRYA